MRDRRLHGCVACLVQLRYSSLRNGTFLISCRDFLQGFVVLPWQHFQALHRMEPQKERSDGVVPGRLGDISSFFHAHGKEGQLPVSDECWIVHQDL